MLLRCGGEKQQKHQNKNCQRLNQITEFPRVREVANRQQEKGNRGDLFLTAAPRLSLL